MSGHSLIRWGGVAVIVTAVLFAIGGILLVVSPGGGLGNSTVPLLYYLGTITAVPALMALYASQFRQVGKLGFAGFLLGVVGAILYSGPQLALVAGTSGAAGWHDVWGFAMGNVLLIGPTFFLLGKVLLGISIARSGTLPRWSARLMAAGAFLWLIAYFLSVVPFLLTVANLISGAGLTWLGWVLWAGHEQEAAVVPQVG